MIKWPCIFPSWKHLWYLKEKKKTQPKTNKQNKPWSQSHLTTIWRKVWLLLLPPLPHSNGQLLPQKVFQHKQDNSWYFRTAILRFAYKCLCLARQIHCSWQPADLIGGTNTLFHKPNMLYGLCSLQQKDGGKKTWAVLKALQVHLSSNFIQQQPWKNILLDEVMLSITSCRQAQHLGLQRKRLGFPCC